MRFPIFIAVVVLAHVAVVLDGTMVSSKHHTHHKHGRHHHQHHKHGHHHSTGRSTEVNTTDVANASSVAVGKAETKAAPVSAAPNSSSATAPAKAKNASKVSAAQMSAKMQAMEKELAAKEAKGKEIIVRGRLNVNGPLPAGFAQYFAEGVSKATGCDPNAVNIIDTNYADNSHSMMFIDFEAPTNVVHQVEDQAADPYSRLSNGVLRPFLVAGASLAEIKNAFSKTAGAKQELSLAETSSEASNEESESGNTDAAPEPCQQNIDIDTEMPYGELEPFGREDTAQELTEQSITESDEMVDQLERAEVAEEKRAVFRALTRLRGAAITSFDGIARSQTGNIDEYNKVHKWRMTHPLRHLADEESDISKWAFPDNADF